jgi:hypothetical protein
MGRKMEELLMAIPLAVAGLAYIFSLERRLSVQAAQMEAMKELFGVKLDNIDQRTQRIEKKVLNGDAH